MSLALEPLSGRVESDRSSEREELDRSLERLAGRARAFARLTIAEKVGLLRACARSVEESAEAWVRSGHRAKGLPEGSGEEWLVGPVPLLRNLRLLAETLERLARGGAAIPPRRVSSRPDGRVEVDVFPCSLLDAALFPGISVRQLMQPGQTVRGVIERAGSVYHDGRAREGVALVLGAGNVSSIAPMDAVFKLFAEGLVCLVKMNPVNEWMGPHLEHALRPLIAAGFLDLAYGGADVGAYLVEHPLVDEVHITGSNQTHDLIVWGPPGPERERRKRANDPVLKKKITSELGNVSPVVIVPTIYTDLELRIVAANVAGMVVNNASFNCNAAKLLVVSRFWPQREALLRAVSAALAQVPTRLAYYPGARERYDRLVEGRDHVERIGEATATKLPWTLVHDVDPENRDDPVFSVEPFCSLLSVTALDARDPAEMLRASVRFLNESVWGTLNAMIVLPPKLERAVDLEAEVDRAVLDLRYGTVAINQWPAVAYALASPAWGGHPSARLDDIQSGLGWVHDTYLLEGIEKTVLRAPLALFPKPVWFPGHRRQAEVGRRLVALEARPSPWKLPGLALHALQG